MLGSPFDLNKEIERIAAKRDDRMREPQARRVRVYSDFDRRMTDFVHSVGGARGRGPNVDGSAVDRGATRPSADGKPHVA